MYVNCKLNSLIKLPIVFVLRYCLEKTKSSIKRKLLSFIQVGKVSTNFAAAKNGKVGSNFSAAKNGQVSSNSKKR